MAPFEHSRATQLSCGCASLFLCCSWSCDTYTDPPDWSFLSPAMSVRIGTISQSRGGCSSEDTGHGPGWCLLGVTPDALSHAPSAKPTEVCQREVTAQQKGQGAEAKGEEAQVPPVHPPGPKAGQGGTRHGLLLRQDPAAATALPAATDPQPAAAAATALQLPGHPACPSQVGAQVPAAPHMGPTACRG